MSTDREPPDTRQGATQTRAPITRLGAFLDCLHIIEELPPADRMAVVEALHSMKVWGSAILAPKTEAGS